MSSIPSTPRSLPSSPRANRLQLPPLNTNFNATGDSQSPLPYSPSASFRDGASRPSMSQSDHIFTNATIPLSPVSSASSSLIAKEPPYDGLAPRKRNPISRLISCFKRKERLRRRAAKASEYEKVGESGHWTEY